MGDTERGSEVHLLGSGILQSVHALFYRWGLRELHDGRGDGSNTGGLQASSVEASRRSEKQMGSEKPLSHEPEHQTFSLRPSTLFVRRPLSTQCLGAHNSIMFPAGSRK